MMTDEKIVEMYWQRKEKAIEETEKKYGKYCFTVAFNILRNASDSEECVNDTYMSAWNSMPEQRPSKLKAFLAKITRNISLARYRYYNAEKRGGAETDLALDELLECVSGCDNTEDIIDTIHFAVVMDGFLDSIGEMAAKVFICRYWYIMSVNEIAAKYNMTENRVKVSLHRSRNALKEILIKEGLY